VRPPDVIGPTASAWNIKLTGNDACVGLWLVNGPFHPVWTWWAIIALHLRPIAGREDPYKEYPSAGHEIQIISLDPNHPIDIDDIDRGGALHILTPPDCFVQCGGLMDIQAAAVVTGVAYMVCHGYSPDEEQQAWWRSAILRAAQLTRTGGMEYPVSV
jgi:hypothetical protein